MSLQNSVFYKNVTNTGAVFAAPSTGNYVIHGYSLKSSGASALIDITDAGAIIATIGSTAAANGLCNMFPVGVKCSGAVALAGVSSNIANITLFWNKE